MYTQLENNVSSNGNEENCNHNNMEGIQIILNLMVDENTKELERISTLDTKISITLGAIITFVAFFIPQLFIVI